MRARILYVDPSSKQIKLSLQPELVDLIVRKLPSVSQVFEVKSQAHELSFRARNISLSAQLSIQTSVDSFFNNGRSCFWQVARVCYKVSAL